MCVCVCGVEEGGVVGCFLFVLFLLFSWGTDLIGRLTDCCELPFKVTATLLFPEQSWVVVHVDSCMHFDNNDNDFFLLIFL